MLHFPQGFKHICLMCFSISKLIQDMESSLVVFLIFYYGISRIIALHCTSHCFKKTRPIVEIQGKVHSQSLHQAALLKGDVSYSEWFSGLGSHYFLPAIYFIALIIFDNLRYLFINMSCVGAVRRVGKSQVAVHARVPRNITVKDVIAVLEREPQMFKSTLIYRFHEK